MSKATYDITTPADAPGVTPVTPSASVRRAWKVVPSRALLLDVIYRCQADLRELGGDWESGLPGSVRYRILENANKLLRLTRLLPHAPKSRSRAWSILYDWDAETWK